MKYHRYNGSPLAVYVVLGMVGVETASMREYLEDLQGTFFSGTKELDEELAQCKDKFEVLTLDDFVESYNNDDHDQSEHFIAYVTVSIPHMSVNL